jgi:hypothetical protein
MVPNMIKSLLESTRAQTPLNLEDYDKKVKIVGLSGQASSCVAPTDYPVSDDSTGTFMAGRALICGGYFAEHSWFYYDPADAGCSTRTPTSTKAGATLWASCWRRITPWQLLHRHRGRHQAVQDWR